ERAFLVALVEEGPELLGRRGEHAQARKPDLEQAQPRLRAHVRGDGIAAEGRELAEDLALLEHRAPAQERPRRDRGEDHGPRRSAAARADHARSTRPRTRALRRRHVGAPAHLRRTRLRLVSPVALADEDLGRALDDVEGRVAVLALAED